MAAEAPVIIFNICSVYIHICMHIHIYIFFLFCGQVQGMAAYRAHLAEMYKMQLSIGPGTLKIRCLHQNEPSCLHQDEPG